MTQWSLAQSAHSETSFQVISCRELNPLRPRQNGRHFAGGIFNYNIYILVNFHLSLFPRVQLTKTNRGSHYGDVVMSAIASQITSLAIVYSTVYLDADQRKHQSSASLAFVRGIHRGPVNSPHKWTVTRKMFPFDDVIMQIMVLHQTSDTAIIWTQKLYGYHWFRRMFCWSERIW